jgi:hypothetical protein
MLNLVQVTAYTGQVGQLVILLVSTYVGHPSLIGSTGRSKMAACSTLLRLVSKRSHRFTSIFWDDSEDDAMGVGGAAVGGGAGGGAVSFVLPLELDPNKLRNGSLAKGLSRCAPLSFCFCTIGVDFEEPEPSTIRNLVVTAGVRSRSDNASNEGVEGRDGFFSVEVTPEGVLDRGILNVVLLIFILVEGVDEDAARVGVGLGGGTGVTGVLGG